MARKTVKRPKRAAVLPPIPTDTPEGIRLHAIADTLWALDTPLPASMSCGLELQTEDERALAERLNVPVLFIGSVLGEHRERNSAVEDIEEYIAWRQRVAGKAVA